MNDEAKDLILGVFEASLDAQLRAVRRLRHGGPSPVEPRPVKVCRKLTWLSTYLRRHVPRYISPSSSSASNCSSASRSIAKAWSRRSPRK